MIKQILLFLLDVYRFGISPVIHLLAGPGMGCRHTPTCSEYSKRAITESGVIKGIKLTAVRLSRCHPWAKPTVDLT